MSIYDELVNSMKLIYAKEATYADQSFILRDAIYPKVEAVLSTKAGNDKFQRIVSQYIDANADKLYTAGPRYKLVFSMSEKQKYFDLFDVNPDEVKKLVKQVTSKINTNSQWKLITDNPIFVLLYFVIRYYTIQKDKAGVNKGLAILGVSIYPSVFSKYYKYEPNPAVMQYTIDNLSMKYNIKKTMHIFGNIMTCAQQSWSTHEKNIIKGFDGDVIEFTTRCRHDQNSFMRKITGEFQNNYQNKLTVYSIVDAYEDESNAVVENDSNKVETVTKKIVNKLMTYGPDARLSEAAAKMTRVSVTDLRNYVNLIIVDKNINDMITLIENILFVFLYDGKNKIRDINSKRFLEISLAIFKRTNSQDENVNSIKFILDKWVKDIGLERVTSRVATIIDYKRAIFTFFVFSIQRYNN